jgi:hypothetical protein
MRHHALSRIRILAQDPQPFQNSTLNEGITTEFRFVDDPLPRSRLNHNVLNDSEVGFSSPPLNDPGVGIRAPQLQSNIDG